MKTQLIRIVAYILFLIVFNSNSYSQFNNDTLILNDGSKIACTIGRVGSNNYMYSTGSGYDKIKKDKVSSYYIKDKMFSMDVDGKLSHEVVAEVEGFTKDEIYRALIDWVISVLINIDS